MKIYDTTVRLRIATRWDFIHVDSFGNETPILGKDYFLLCTNGQKEQRILTKEGQKELKTFLATGQVLITDKSLTPNPMLHPAYEPTISPTAKAQQLIEKFLEPPLCTNLVAAKYASENCVKEILQSIDSRKKRNLDNSEIQERDYWLQVGEALKEELFSPELGREIS